MCVRVTWILCHTNAGYGLAVTDWGWLSNTSGERCVLGKEGKGRAWDVLATE